MLALEILIYASVNCGFSGFVSLKYLLVATLGIVSKLSLPSLKRNLENPLFIQFSKCYLPSTKDWETKNSRNNSESFSFVYDENLLLLVARE